MSVVEHGGYRATWSPSSGRCGGTGGGGPGETIDAAGCSARWTSPPRAPARGAGRRAAAPLGQRAGVRHALRPVLARRARRGQSARSTCRAWTTPTTGRSTSTPCATCSPSCCATATPQRWPSWPARSSTRWAGRAAVGHRHPRARRAAHWSAYQALRMLSPETLLARSLADLRAGPTRRRDSFAEEVLRREIRDRIAAFRKMITDEVRRRTAELRGREPGGAHRPCRSRSSRWSSSPPTPSSSPSCAAPCTRSPGASRRGSRCAAGTPSAARSTCAARCAARCPPAACRCARPTGPAARAVRSW